MQCNELLYTIHAPGPASAALNPPHASGWRCSRLQLRIEFDSEIPPLSHPALIRDTAIAAEPPQPELPSLYSAPQVLGSWQSAATGRRVAGAGVPNSQNAEAFPRPSSPPAANSAPASQRVPADFFPDSGYDSQLDSSGQTQFSQLHTRQDWASARWRSRGLTPDHPSSRHAVQGQVDGDVLANNDTPSGDRGIEYHILPSSPILEPLSMPSSRFEGVCQPPGSRPHNNNVHDEHISAPITSTQTSRNEPLLPTRISGIDFGPMDTVAAGLRDALQSSYPALLSAALLMLLRSRRALPIVKVRKQLSTHSALDQLMPCVWSPTYNNVGSTTLLLVENGCALSPLELTTFPPDTTYRNGMVAPGTLVQYVQSYLAHRTRR